jgi:hypothetical protein
MSVPPQSTTARRSACKSIPSAIGSAVRVL